MRKEMVVMEKNKFKKRQYFSIRKYSVGACSVLLGTSLFLSLSTDEVKAEDRTANTIVPMHHIDENSLTDELRKQLLWFEENKIDVKEGRDYYFIYRKKGLLPNTGLFSNTNTALLGVGLLLVCLTLVKKKRGKMIFLVSVLTLSGGVNHAFAFEDLVEIKPVVYKEAIGGKLPVPDEIPGYTFTGWYLVRDRVVGINEGVNEEVPGDENVKPKPEVKPESKFEWEVPKEAPKEDELPKFEWEVPKEAPKEEGLPKFEWEVPKEAPKEDELVKYPEDKVPTYSEVPKEAPTTPKPEAKVVEKIVEYKTHYEADSSLKFKETVETRGENGRELKITAPVYDENDNQIGTEMKKEVTEPKNKIIKMGNVETTRRTVPKTEVYEADETKNLDYKKVKEPGKDGEQTITATYEVNEKTGKLENPSTKTEETIKMIPKVTLVGALDVTREALEMNLVYEADPTLPRDETKVKQEGRAGRGENATYYYYRVNKDTGEREGVAYKQEIRKEKPIPSEDRIILVGTKPKVEQLSIPYETRYEADPDLEYGVQKEVTPGKRGIDEFTTTYTVNEEGQMKIQQP